MTKQKQNQNKKTKQGQKTKLVPQNQVTSMVQSAVRAAMKSVPMPKKQTFLGDLGAFAGNGISKIFGLGAYKLNSNSLYDQRTGSQVPFMHSTDESIIFRHREYIGDITSTTAFTATTYAINPALSDSFPFMSTIASCFQEYKFRGLVYEFKSTSAVALVNGTNTGMGTVALAAQYRADAPPLTNRVDVLNNMWTADGRPSDNFILPIECAPKENPMSILYTRTGAVTGDQKLYDIATLTVATSGSPGSNVVGELWASYEVELLKPQVTPTGGVIANSWITSTDFTSAAPLGVTTLERYDGIGVDVTSGAITFPGRISGDYIIELTYSGSVAGVINGPAVTFTNCNGINYYIGATSTTYSCPANGVNSAFFMLSIAVTIGVDAIDSVVAINGAGVYPTGTTRLTISICKLDPATA